MGARPRVCRRIFDQHRSGWIGGQIQRLTGKVVVIAKNAGKAKGHAARFG